MMFLKDTEKPFYLNAHHKSKQITLSQVNVLKKKTCVVMAVI